jgi:uncharacterized membrane protein YoaK (UPF0700 family)
MTGNTVLLGVALARGSDAARSAAALGGFCLGVPVGVALIGIYGRWPRVARRAFSLLRCVLRTCAE